MQPERSRPLQRAVIAPGGMFFLEEPRDNPRRSGAGSTIRRRVLLLCLLPTLFLGVTYFLLVAFALRDPIARVPAPLLLRYGGPALVLLFSLVALACGSLLADAFLRPLRALLRVAEAQQANPGTTAYLSDPDPELRRLFLRVFTLLQQNRSGAQALRDLDSLRGDVARLCEAFRGAEAAGVLPAPGSAGNGGPTSELLLEMDRFWTRLRSQLEAVEEKLAHLNRSLNDQETAAMTAAARLEDALHEIERLGTVWSLEIERARRDVPRLPGALGSCFREFAASLERLRDAARANGPGVHAAGEVRTELARLEETLADLLHGEVEIEREDMQREGDRDLSHGGIEQKL